MTKPIALYGLLSLLLCLGCKKENTTWETNWKAPLIKGKITIADVLPDHHFENTDDYVSLSYNDTVYSFRIDTLIKLPDTTLVHKTAIQFPQWTLSPGSVFPTFDINQDYDLGDISLKRVIVKEGKGKFTLLSSWPGKTKAEFVFPKLLDTDGQVFVREYHLEPGTIDNPYILVDSFEMTNFDFDLTGENGDLYNNVTAHLTMSSEEETDNFTVTSQDTVELEVTFYDMTAKYALGYFGEHELSDTTIISIPEMEKLEGIINLDSINLKLNIQNGFDIAAQTKITSLHGTNTNTNQVVPLNFLQFNQFINLNPATGGLWDNAPSDYHINIDNTNSNILPFIENLPGELNFGYLVHVNPFGNVGGGTDQYFPNSKINLLLDGELPLNVRMENFSLSDTFKVSANDIAENLIKGEIIINYINSFPLSARVFINFLDANENIIDSVEGNSLIMNGNYDNTTEKTTAHEGQVSFSLDETNINHLTDAGLMEIKVTFNSYDNQFVKINMTDSIDFKVISNLDLNLSVK